MSGSIETQRLPKVILFDLDGTLLDSLPGIRHSAEAAFTQCALPLGQAEVRSLIGPPIRIILQRMAAGEVSESVRLPVGSLGNPGNAGDRKAGWYAGIREGVKPVSTGRRNWREVGRLGMEPSRPGVLPPLPNR